MLILKRQIGQKLYIGHEVIIEVLEISGYGKKSQIRIGITAPKVVAVHREEIYLRIQADITER